MTASRSGVYDLIHTQGFSRYINGDHYYGIAGMEAKRNKEKSVEILESEVQRLRNAVDQLSALNELARLISTAQDFEALHRRLVRQSLQMIGAEQGVVTLLEENNFAPMSTLIRTRARQEDIQEFRPNDAVVGWMSLNKMPLRIDDVREAKAYEPDKWHPEIRSVLCVPLLIKTRLIGLLSLFNKSEGRFFQEEDEQLLFIIAMQSAQVIENQRLLHIRNQELEEKVAQQTAVLQQKNLELEKTLADLKRTQQQLVQQEKMASLGQLTTGIAHEIRNPLNFINNFAQLNTELLEELKENAESSIEDVRELIEAAQLNASKINEHGQRAERIVQSMMQHASGQTGRRERTEVNRLVEDYIMLAYHGKKAHQLGVTVKIERKYGDQTGYVEMVSQEIGQVLVNLFNNAFDAMLEKAQKVSLEYVPTIYVSTSHVLLPPGNRWVEIRIADNGPGIASRDRDKIFDPFYTTKPSGSGTGLGLSLSQDIVVKGHGGSLSVESEEGKGATFIVRLPAD